MNLSSFLAKKYYFSKSRKSFVNKISILAIAIIALMVIAEIVILSVFNGFTDQLKNIHYAFDSDLELKPKTGKVFELDALQKNKLKQCKEIQVYTEILEDDAILDYKGRQDVIRFKGVSNTFFKQNLINRKIEQGSVNIFTNNPVSSAIIGSGIVYKFDINMKSAGFFTLMYPNREKSHFKKSQNSYQQTAVEPIGVFRIEMEYDERYIIMPIEAVRALTSYKNQCTSLELKLNKGFTKESVEPTLQKIFRNTMQIQDREERHLSIYKAIKVEKMMTYLIFLFILIIASLNLYAAVSMLVLSKQKDIETLNVLGTSAKNIQKIFLIEGMYIIGTGICIGLSLAFGLVYMQGSIGLVSVPEPNVLVTHIPVRMSVTDFILSTLLTFIVSILMIIKPILSSTKNVDTC